MSRPRLELLVAPLVLTGTRGAPGGEATGEAGVIRDGAVLIEGDRIVYAGPRVGLAHVGPDVQVTEMEGTILPGLIDAHVHLVASGEPELASVARPSPAVRTCVALSNAARHLAAGVTAVRDLGAPADEAIAVGDAAARGLLEGPTVIASGPAITMTGGHIPYLGRVADGVSDIRKAVRECFALGARCIKVVATGGVLTPGLDPGKPSFRDPELRALVSEAHRLGLPVAAHAIGAQGVLAAARAGVDSVEHAMFLDEPALEALAAAGTRLVPTLSALRGILDGPSVPEWTKARGRPARPAQRRSLAAAHAAGIRIVAGTDAGTPDNPHGSLPGELELMVAAGMSAQEALHATTAAAAELLGLTDRGVLASGMVADLLVVHGDPTVDITALQSIQAVYLGGRRLLR